MKKITIKEFYEIITNIPDEDFIQGRFSDENHRCCIIGHAVRISSNKSDDYSTENCSDSRIDYENGCNLRKISRKFISDSDKFPFKGWDISDVNNGFIHSDYMQSGIKERVIRFVYDLISNGYGDEFIV